jgi:hypothetical protein
MIDHTSNRISHVMEAAKFADAKASLQKLTEHLAFMVKLSQEEVDALNKISDADKTFIRNCLTEMPNATEFLPAYFKTEEVQKDLVCGDQLLELENVLFELYTNVRKNRMLANAEAYAGASVFYRLTHAAGLAGSASAKSMHQRMQSYHINKRAGGRSSKKVETT